MTRQQVQDLKVGDVLEMCLETRDGQPLPEARWAFRGPVTRIYARREDVNGKLFACFYQQFGERSEISGSVKEGESLYRLAAPVA